MKSAKDLNIGKGLHCLSFDKDSKTLTNRHPLNNARDSRCEVITRYASKRGRKQRSPLIMTADGRSGHSTINVVYLKTLRTRRAGIRLWSTC